MANTNIPSEIIFSLDMFSGKLGRFEYTVNRQYDSKKDEAGFDPYTYTVQVKDLNTDRIILLADKQYDKDSFIKLMTEFKVVISYYEKIFPNKEQDLEPAKEQTDWVDNNHMGIPGNYSFKVLRRKVEPENYSVEIINLDAVNDPRQNNGLIHSLENIYQINQFIDFMTSNHISYNKYEEVIVTKDKGVFFVVNNIAQIFKVDTRVIRSNERNLNVEKISTIEDIKNILSLMPMSINQNTYENLPIEKRKFFE